MHKIKLLAAAVLALSAAAAQAVNVNNNITLDGDAESGFSAGLSDPSGTLVNHKVSGLFTDTFTFSFAGGALVDVWLNTSASATKLATQQIVFTSATLNGVALQITNPYELGGTVFRGAELFEVPTSGTLQLIVHGYAGLQGSSGSTISASYSGGLNLIPTAVPEPGTYAMLLAGLGVVGFVARRRQRKG
ncbi:PEP-CTERM sorting domain-containing protein [Roseateles sp. DAIF2]|uniref:FxDxF family PEP-CTERM protein n=1 Tax=Roseateles sp. DAIF2 TaxID=2714952 RepID=UPI0018A327C1|nr:FxDxF family PEP-CTERM protein [Roseateles sp. DAIF2]QPF75218.1 PEP-CTERM sorting domain-containing protein [Roseateles sp. DAIF2]